MAYYRITLKQMQPVVVGIESNDDTEADRDWALDLAFEESEWYIDCELIEE